MITARAPLAPAPAPPAASRARRLTAVAGALQLSGLATALGGGSVALAAAQAGAGALIGAGALLPRVVRVVSRDRGALAVAVLLLIAAWWLARSALRLTHTSLSPLLLTPFGYAHLAAPSVVGRAPLLAAVAVSAVAGLVLLADAVRVWLGLAPRQRAPWKEMTAADPGPDRIAGRALAGVALVVLAAILVIGSAGSGAAQDPAGRAIVLLVTGVMVAGLIGTPVAIGSFMRVDRDKAGRERERERQRFAAHLHDSVLQTLALVQRQANDPAAVARLARRQEHALRAWMAGEAELSSETIGGALRDAVAGVEDESGVTIEVTAIGDRELDPAGEALVAAAREALRNAARHAGGAPVFVFAELSARAAEVFVRDDGPGFELDAVPAERRGIRDAIVGRMAAAGGEATVESVVGEGTEVALRLPARRARR